MDKNATPKQAITQMYKREGRQPLFVYEAEVEKHCYTTGDVFSATIIALWELSYVKDSEGRYGPAI